MSMSRHRFSNEGGRGDYFPLIFRKSVCIVFSLTYPVWEFYNGALMHFEFDM